MDYEYLEELQSEWKHTIFVEKFHIVCGPRDYIDLEDESMSMIPNFKRISISEFN